MSQQPDSSSTAAAIPSFNITSSSSSQSLQKPNLLTAGTPPRSRASQLQPNNNNNNSSTRSLFVGRLILAIVLLFVFISVVNFLGWRILHLLPPVFEVNSFHISISSTPSSTPNADYTILFAITNPNKKLSLLLDHFELSVFEGKRETTASRERMQTDESLNLHHYKNTKDFTVRGRVPQHIISTLGNQREAKFNVQVKFRTIFLASYWLPKRELLVVYCRDLSVRFLSENSTGSFTGEKGKCSVHGAV